MIWIGARQKLSRCVLNFSLAANPRSKQAKETKRIPPLHSSHVGHRYWHGHQHLGHVKLQHAAVLDQRVRFDLSPHIQIFSPVEATDFKMKRVRSTPLHQPKMPPFPHEGNCSQVRVTMKTPRSGLQCQLDGIGRVPEGRSHHDHAG